MYSDINNDLFAGVFTDLIKKSGYTDAEVARRLHVNRSTVGRWKSGEQSPPLSKMREVARFFDVNPRVFIEENADINADGKNDFFEELERELGVDLTDPVVREKLKRAAELIFIDEIQR